MVHIQPSYTTQWGKKISPRRQSAFRDLIQRSDDKMAFSRAMPKKREATGKIDQDDVHSLLRPEGHHTSPEQNIPYWKM